MLSKGDLPVVPDTQENREWIAGHVHAMHVSHLDMLRVNLALSDQASTLSTSVCKDDHILIAGTAGYSQSVSVQTFKGIFLEFALDCLCRL